MTNSQTLEVLNVLKGLPSDKIDEVKDFAVFLREKYGTQDTADISDEWSEEDLQEFAMASFEYAATTENQGVGE
ncbi:MAG: hypothetical protein ACT4O9_16960 [Blastocatellia bacterium]